MTEYNFKQKWFLIDQITRAFLLYCNSPGGKIRFSDDAQNFSGKVVILGDSSAMHQLRQKWAVTLISN